MYYAYIHCKPNGTPFYVGKGTSRRVAEIKRSGKFHSDVVKKYGVENILVGKLECSTEEIAFELEKGLIKCLRRAGVKLANQTDGGEGSSGWKAPQEVRQKHRENTLGVKNPFYGKKHSEELKQRESIRAKLQWSGPDLRAKVSERSKKYIGEKNPFFGKQHTETSNEANRKAHLGLGRKKSEEERQACSERVSGEKHHFYGKKLTPEHIEKMSLGMRKAALGSRFMWDGERNRRVVKKDLELRLSEGWTFTRKFKV